MSNRLTYEESKPVIERMLVTSTASVSKPTSALLDARARGEISDNDFPFVVYDHNNNGWLVHTGVCLITTTNLYHGNGDVQVPPDLLHVLFTAKADGCQWVLLDMDAEHDERFVEWSW